MQHRHSSGMSEECASLIVGKQKNSLWQFNVISVFSPHFPQIDFMSLIRHLLKSERSFHSRMNMSDVRQKPWNRLTLQTGQNLIFDPLRQKQTKISSVRVLLQFYVLLVQLWTFKPLLSFWVLKCWFWTLRRKFETFWMYGNKNASDRNGPKCHFRAFLVQYFSKIFIIFQTAAFGAILVPSHPEPYNCTSLGPKSCNQSPTCEFET